MMMAWKEMKRNKPRFMIFGLMVTLVSLLTFMISGLANGLSFDSAGLLKELPEGDFYMTKEAEENSSQSSIDPKLQEDVLSKPSAAVAFSIQMGMLNKQDGKQENVAFASATESKWFVQVQKGEIILDRSLEEAGINTGDIVTTKQLSGSQLVVKGFVDTGKYSHAPVAYISLEDYQAMTGAQGMQMLYIPGEESPQAIAGLQSFSKDQFLNTISSYKAEQTSLKMIIWFLIVISGMLFAIFFYMMNVQKLGLYGILKAMGVKTSTLFTMMWTQLAVVTILSLGISILLSQVFNRFAPPHLPFHLTADMMISLSLVFLAIGFIGATVSGLQIQKVEPMQAIQQGEI